MRAERRMSQCVEMYLAWCAGRLAPKTIEWYRHFLNKLAVSVQDKHIEDVSRLDVEMWSAARANLVAAATFFRWCRKTAKLIRKNPCKGIAIPKGARRTRVLLRRERVILRRNARPGLYRATLALEEGAFRPLEMRTLRWEWIRGLEGEGLSESSLTSGDSYAVFEEFKGLKRRRRDTGPRVVPISPRLGRLLWRMRRELLDVRGVVFVTDRGQAWTANGLRCAWRRLRASVAARDAIEPKGLVPYTLRHTRATELAAIGTNQQLLAEFLGHSDIRMTSWYVHASISDLCALMKAKKRK